ncbi:extracellular solute-binding protein [Thermoflexus sp.]|uniref:extracellular solute-binding protein n=1 Tax=Thermoflexus sp. TaxID=1969742 RepID=UPI002606187B|nr:extracellular solute-binding protein [Thermoflexus sp.]MCX7691176.1 extracellular solute-binding protein [Thermoflexus sp.]
MRFRPRWTWILLLGMVACTSVANPPRLIVLWHALDPERGIALARLTEAYMAEHPDIAIYIEAFPGSRELLNRLQQPSERGPDLVLIPVEAVSELWETGRLIPLRRWLEDPQQGLSAEEREDLLAPITPGSLPFLRDGLIIYADEDRLLESGFERPPTDWEGIRQVCMRGALDLNGDGRPDTAGWIAPRDGRVLQGWLARRSTAEWGEWVEDMAFMLRTGCGRLMESRAALRAFLEGETVILFGPTRWLPVLERETEAGRLKFRLALAPLPAPSGQVGPILPGWGEDLAITARDPGQQIAAWSFLRWAVGIEAQMRWAQDAQSLPIRRTAAMRLRSLSGGEDRRSMVLSWALQGYFEETSPDPSRLRRMGEALDLLGGGADVSVVLERLQGP